jgi:putative ABC transport system permease protein
VSVLDHWRLAVRALRANWFRGLLTTLGVIIGVASLVDLTAISAGAQAGVAASLERLGPNIVILDGQPVSPPGQTAVASDITITPTDVREIGRLPAVSGVAPYHQLDLPMAAGRRSVSAPILAITPAYGALHNFRAQAGRVIGASDEAYGQSVIVLGPTARRRLFPDGASPLGRTVRIVDREFTVVGVLERKGTLGQDNLDNRAYVPLSVAKRALFGGDKIRSVDIQVRSDSQITPVQDEIGTLLRRLHRLPPGSPDDFATEDQASILKTAQDATRTFRILTLALGGIALLVGGIGIMNIMLVSVTERTHEIGIRKAVGADPRRIQTQFVIEAVLLSSLGGLLGAVAGVGSARLITRLAGWQTQVSSVSLLVALGVAVGVGVFFGYYPARRAARLDPVVALRHE